MDDDEIRRAATRWLELHGEDAIPMARDVVTVARRYGDTATADEWSRIIVVVEEMRRTGDA